MLHIAVKSNIGQILSKPRFLERSHPTLLNIASQSTKAYPVFALITDYESNHIARSKLITLFLLQGSFGGYGAVVPAACFILRWIFEVTSLKRNSVCLPSKGQRTRSNAKTPRRSASVWLVLALALFGLKRNHAGAMLAKNNKKTKKPAKSSLKAKPTTKRKGPVKRSKDVKKSVWA